MNKLPILFVTLCLFFSCKLEKEISLNEFAQNQTIISSDLSNFWQAYDAIQTTEDSLEQLQHLEKHFLNKASKGQKRMIEARRYTAAEYIESINNRPQFWNSIRKNTENLEPYNAELRKGVSKLIDIYPEAKLSTIYYTVGNFRSPGSGVDSLVLIGTEFALGDSTTITKELPEYNQDYFKINPTDHLQFLVVHEYVHTQQKAMVHNLLCLTLYEGIAEFVAIIATGSKSPWKAFTYGPANEEKIKKRFVEDMFRPNTTFNWLWNSPKNEFQTSELGYYIGYKIASLYYDNAPDKKAALKTLIELDCSDQMKMEALVNSTQFFDASLDDLRKDFEASKPTVVALEQFNNQSETVDPNLNVITLKFSEPMNKERRGFDYGPLGENNVLKVEKVLGFSEDGLSFSFEVKLQPNKRYQSLVTARFLSDKGTPCVPYLIDFKTI